MAKVSDIIFCLGATNIQGLGASANTILTALTPEYIPGLFTFSVIVTMVDVNPSIEHVLLVSFIDPEGKEIVKVDSSIPAIPDSVNNLPMEYKGINIAMDWNNVNLKISGLYTITVSLDGVLLQEKNIFVKGKNE